MGYIISDNPRLGVGFQVAFSFQKLTFFSVFIIIVICFQYKKQK